MNPRDSEQNLRSPKFMKIALQEKDGQGDGSPRLVPNRRRTREGPEPACVQTPFPARVAHAGEGGEGKGELTSCRGYRPVGVVTASSDTYEGQTGLPARVSGRHVVRG